MGMDVAQTVQDKIRQSTTLQAAGIICLEANTDMRLSKLINNNIKSGTSVGHLGSYFQAKLISYISPIRNEL
jgi:hypothetical protein